MLDIVILCFIVKYVDRSIGFKTFRAGFSKTWALKKKIVTPFSLLYLLKKKVVCMSTWTWNYIGFGPKRSFLLGASGSFFSFKRVFPADSVVKKKKKYTCHCRRCKRHGFNVGWEDPLEKGMAAHSNILAQRIPWTEEPGKLQPMGSQRVKHDWAI